MDFEVLFLIFLKNMNTFCVTLINEKAWNLLDVSPTVTPTHSVWTFCPLDFTIECNSKI